MAVLVGTVTDSSSGRPVSDSLVTVTSPNLQGEEIAVTDETGVYRIPGLPPGLYTLRVEAQSFRPYAREALDLHADTTIRLNASLLPEALQAEEVVVVGRTPTVDIGSSAFGLNITSDFTSRIPLIAPGGKSGPARGFEGVADVVPGVTNDLFGASVFGASSPENRYLLDGLSVNNTTFGLLGTPLSIDFIKEVSVLSGGYMPEYGRATGGILNAITKSGTNEFHGSVFTNWAPGALAGRRKTVNIQGQTITTEPSLRYMGDIGGDIGGPIIKDKLWFYFGFDWAQSKFNLKRSLRRTAVDADGNAVLDPDNNPVTEAIPGTSTTRYAQQDIFQHIAKLTWAASKKDRVTLSVNGVYPRSGGHGKYGVDPQTGEAEVYPLATQSQNSLAGTYGATAHRYKGQSTNALLRWNRDLSSTLLLDTWVGWHQENGGRQASDGSGVGSMRGLAGQPNVWYLAPRDLSYFAERGLYDGSVPAQCSEPGYSCPILNYRGGGPEFTDLQKNNRLQARSTLTYLFEALGHHVFKVGIDGEYQRQNGIRGYTGGRDWVDYGDYWYTQAYGFLEGPDQPVWMNTIHNKTSSISVGAFAQDSWNIADVVTLNLGLRWDAQMLLNRDNELAMTLPNQWSPRAGFIFDPTFQGKSKIYANYARYYETVPLRMLDRYLSGEPLLLSLADNATCDPTDRAMGGLSGSCLGSLYPGSGDPPNSLYSPVSSGTSVIDPKLKAPSNDEFISGAEYEIVQDGRLGLNYTRRWLTNTIEDMSPDEGQTFFFGNPGRGIARDFPKAQRKYDGGTLYFTKLFSQGWIAQASYTLSWLRGNYGGLYRADDRQFDPHQNSDFDLRSLFVNRKGDLPGDNRHYVKAFGAKEFKLPKGWGVLTPGASFRAYSGGPTNYLGAHPVYQQDQVYILPRGEGERLPWVASIDLRLAYGFQFSKNTGIMATFDIFNLINFQAAVERDQRYTADTVSPISSKAELPALVNLNGEPVSPNPNFGRPSLYQPPRTFRFGLKGTF
jgi:Carboxypeptidase regulatory-like domain